MSHTDQLLMMSLTRFYHVADNMLTVLPYMNNTSTISLRMIDWFVTNYAKKCNIVISQTKGGSPNVVEYFNVYVSYRTQLKAYSKQQFDPFRRRDRIVLEYDEGTKHVQTTVGQLNFFRWLIDNNVLGYVVAHREVIETDMMQSDRSAYQRSSRRNRAPVALALTLDAGESPLGKEGGLDGMPETPVGKAPPVPPCGSAVTGTRRRTELSKATVPTMNRYLGVCTVVFT
ncbi:MAG: hypothetical protein WDW38_006585 [Sanguina aurantia]